MTDGPAQDASAMHPADPGLPDERTALAWQRTLLAGLTCALVTARLLALVSLPAALVTCVAALSCAGGLSVVVQKRFRRNAGALDAHTPLADARAPFLVTLLILLCGCAAGVFVLAGTGQS